MRLNFYYWATSGVSQKNPTKKNTKTLEVAENSEPAAKNDKSCHFPSPTQSSAFSQAPI